MLRASNLRVGPRTGNTICWRTCLQETQIYFANTGAGSGWICYSNDSGLVWKVSDIATCVSLLLLVVIV
jgi:hypothetical protein